MSADRLLRVQRILERVARVDPASRAEFLARLCGNDADLLAEAQSLLPHFVAMSDFEPKRPPGSFWRLPGTTTFAESESAAGDDPVFNLQPPFYMGQYKIEAVLGRGGMGVVYRGVHATLRREVAIKLLRRAQVTPQQRQQFSLEVEILRQLRHSGIARLVYADTFGAFPLLRPYFVMEHVAGPTLTDYAATKGLSALERLDLLVKVCEAVEYAHERGILHCDLKPANILVATETPKPPNGKTSRRWLRFRHANTSPPPQPKVLDFGVARILAFDSTRSGDTRGGFMGTPEYASPEQTGGSSGSLTPATDVYSLGIVALELLTGQRGSPNTQGRLDLRSVCLNAESNHDQLTKEFRFYLEKIMAKALSRNPATRFASAGRFGGELERLVRRYAAAPSGWSSFKNHVLGFVSSQSDWRHSSLAGALKAVTRTRIAGAMNSQRATTPPNGPRENVNDDQLKK